MSKLCQAMAKSHWPLAHDLSNVANTHTKWKQILRGGEKKLHSLNENIFFSNEYTFEVKTWSKTLQTKPWQWGEHSLLKICACIGTS